MSPKLVSVIIPTYNRADLLVKAIRSVKAQSYPAIQIIVADDGSHDDTSQVVAEFEDVEYYFQENKGQAAARNLGLKHARGEYVASLDSDDTWNENFLEVAVAGLEKYEADFVFLNWIQNYENGQLSSDLERSRMWHEFSKKSDGEWFILDPKEIRKLYIKTCPAPSSALLIKRSAFVAEWNPEMKIADDWYLILEMVVKKKCRAAFNPLPYWTKQVHSSNIYHGREIIDIHRELGIHDESVMARNFKAYFTYPEKVIFKRRLATHYFNYGRLNWRRDGFSSESLKFIVSAFTLAPAGSIFYVLLLSYYSLRNRFRKTRIKYK